MRLAKLNGTEITNICVSDTLLDGWVDVTEIEGAQIRGHLVEGEAVPPANDPRQVLDGTTWKFPLDVLFTENDELRKTYIYGGMTTSTGVKIKTTSGAVSLLEGAITDLKKGTGITSVTFMAAPDNPLTLDLAAMEAIHQEMTGHIQGGFAKQGEIVTRINEGTISTLKELEAEWAQ